MALKANANPFIPGAGSQSSTSSNSKISSFNNTPSLTPASSSNAVNNLSNNKAPSRPTVKSNNSNTSKSFPRVSQGKRGQAQRKAERKGRLTDDVTADPSIESAMYGPANKRGQISLNHLLNFSIAPREQHHFSTPSNARRTPSYGIGSGHHPADKARFIQANHRFVVRPNGDYRAQSIDPDALIPWESILQILVSPQNIMACPICLSETPVAPRMTRCGHIACFPCFIRYFASEDLATGLRGSSLKFRKCPICWDSISLAEIKPVRWYSVDNGLDEDNIVVASEPREGFDVAMRLFMRKPGTTLALPRDDYVPLSQVAVLPEGDVPWHYVPEILHYAWIVKGSEDYMQAESTREISELEQMEKEDETSFGEDGFWTQKAVQRIRDVSATYSDIGQGPARQANMALSTAIRKSTILDPVTEDVPLQYQQNSRPNQRESPYFFYQPRSASHYYLASLDVRILKRAFGDYENFPSAILARVEHITTPQTIDDDLRRRWKYLAHLPSGTQISFLECDWTETIDPEILGAFTLEIEKRQRLRREKLVREEKEREQEDRSRRFGRRVYSSYTDEDVLVGSRSQDSEDVTWVIANAVAGIQSDNPSSAEVLASSPVPLATSVDTNVGKTVWGTPRVTTAVTTPLNATPQRTATPVVDEDEPGESGGMWTQNWEEMLRTDRADASKNGSRKKKGKKLVLMSNSVQRGV